jgi:AcrR family transcriptional regulator
VSAAAPLENERPGGPRSRKGAATRARILEAAKQVFEENGFLDTRISDIAQRAGLSHGSFYHYFDSKEQIFREVAEALEDRLSAPVGNIILDSSSRATPRDRIREGNRRYLESYRDEARIMGVIEQVSRYDHHIGSMRLSHQKHTSAQVADSIRQLQRHGLADPTLDPEIAAIALGGMVTRFAEQWLVQGFPDSELDDVVEQITTLFVNALGVPDGVAPIGETVRPSVERAR